ncbi:hypothetical protein [Nonomuraea sp. 10N515B]
MCGQPAEAGASMATAASRIEIWLGILTQQLIRRGMSSSVHVL